MKLLSEPALRPFRVVHPMRGVGDDYGGAFLVPHHKTGVQLRVIASNAEGWDHVSVSLPNRCPNWLEMSAIHRLFFKDGEVAFQLHMPERDHINCHPYCLHLWRSHDVDIPLPPAEFVGPLSPDQAYRQELEAEIVS